MKTDSAIMIYKEISRTSTAPVKKYIYVAVYQINFGVIYVFHLI